jgi:hypothetical protein
MKLVDMVAKYEAFPSNSDVFNAGRLFPASLRKDYQESSWE